VYIFSGDIGNANYEPPPRLHLIQIATEPSDRNTHFALKANATYSLQTQINKSTLAHFTSCLGMGQISSRLTIFTSARLSIKAIYGPIRATSSNGSQTTLELKFFSREIPPYLIVRHAKSDVDYVSIQMVLAGFDGSLLVFNRAWRRASTAAEWAASINPAWYAVPFIQLRAVEALKAMGLASPWTVPEVKVRALKDVAIAKKKSEAIEKLILPLFSGADVFSDSQRAYLLLTGLYGGRRYYDELYEALTRGILDGPYLMIPPYLVFGDETIVDISQYNCGMAPIKFTARRYARLRSMIQDFRNEISDLQ
jgi:hypothetical protein